MYKYIFLAVVISLLGCVFYRGTWIRSNDKADYVVIGCSAAGLAAAKELTKLRPNSKITCITEENSMPYDKTLLQSYISGKKDGKKISLEKDDKKFKAIVFRLNSRVVEIKKDQKQVVLANNDVINYDKLLVATGAKPNLPEQLTFAASWPEVKFYNTKEDADNFIERATKNDAKIVVIGAGIRSLELVDAIKRRNASAEVTIANRSARFFGQSGDNNLDVLIMEKLNSRGIKFLAPLDINRLSLERISDGVLNVSIGGANAQTVNLIVFALGTAPNSQLAKDAHLDLYENGAIKVDDELRTSDPNIFAAGDVVAFSNPVGDGLVSSNKWQASKEQGKIAAQNMAGKNVRYHHEPSAHLTSFFGMKAIIAGDVRSAPLDEHSIIDQDQYHYFHFVFKNDRLAAFAMMWDKKHVRPNIFFLRTKFVKQSLVSPRDFLRKIK